MKKILVTALFSSSILFSNFAHADKGTDSKEYKTQGRYIGMNANLVKVSVKDSIPSSTTGTDYNTTRKARLGLNYQYAFNHKNFFISPEVFLDAIEYKNEDTARSSDNLAINTRYGVKANIGYDFVEQKFSPYVTFGRATVEYKSTKFNSVSLTTVRKSGTQSSAIYGFGSNFDINESLIATIEYNRQKVNLDQGSGLGRFDTKINSLKFGLAYKF